MIYDVVFLMKGNGEFICIKCWVYIVYWDGIDELYDMSEDVD